MYPISSADKALYDAEQPQVLRITGTDKNNVAISITDADIMTDSFSIDRYSCNGSMLEVGTAIASELTFKLNNTDGRFNSIVFEGAELFVEIGIADWSAASPTVSWMPCGYFIPDQQPRRTDIITVKAMDRMQMFDKMQPSLVKWTTNTDAVMTDNNGNEFYFNSYIAFPVTVANLINRVCEHCGVILAQSITSLPNANYLIAEIPPIQQPITYRNLIQWAAGFMGTNAWFDWNGQLRFSWYNNTTGYTTTPANRYESDYQENNLTITGVQYTNAQNVAIVSGSSTYALDLKDNMMVGPYIAEILPTLANAIVGFTYRPFTASVVNAPYLWPMDVVTFEDKNGNSYTSVLTNVNISINSTTELQSVGETEQTNSTTAPTSLTPEQAKLISEAMNSVNALDQSLTQRDIFNRLTNNGQTQGMILYNGQLYINATYIKTGIISDSLEKNYWNLNTGDFSLSATATIPAVTNLDNSLNQQGVFNRLTNNGQVQGIVLQNGQLYINASYINSGTIQSSVIGSSSITSDKIASSAITSEKIASGAVTANMITTGTMSADRIQGGTLQLGGQNNQNGVLQIRDASGTVTGTLNNSGANIAGSITTQITDQYNDVYKVAVTNGSIIIYVNNSQVGTVKGKINPGGLMISSNTNVDIGTNNAYITYESNAMRISAPTLYIRQYSNELYSEGITQDVQYVKDVINGVPTYGTLSFINGICVDNL